MASDSKQYTAFTVPGRGLFQWRVMPFGLHPAAATFKRALDSIIGTELHPFTIAYLDGIIVIGRDIAEHTRNLLEVFQRLRTANLRINKEKSVKLRWDTEEQAAFDMLKERLTCPDGRTPGHTKDNLTGCFKVLLAGDVPWRQKAR